VLLDPIIDTIHRYVSPCSARRRIRRTDGGGGGEGGDIQDVLNSLTAELAIFLKNESS
jgi:hypothetical protein